MPFKNPKINFQWQGDNVQEPHTHKKEKNTTALMHRNFPIGCIGFSSSLLAR